MKDKYNKHREFMHKMHEKYYGHHNHEFEHGHHGHGHFENQTAAERISDDTIKCLCCPNQCIMTVKDGSVTGNRCPRGAMAANSINDDK